MCSHLRTFSLPSMPCRTPFAIRFIDKTYRKESGKADARSSGVYGSGSPPAICYAVRHVLHTLTLPFLPSVSGPGQVVVYVRVWLFTPCTPEPPPVPRPDSQRRQVTSHALFLRRSARTFRSDRASGTRCRLGRRLRAAGRLRSARTARTGDPVRRSTSMVDPRQPRCESHQLA